MAAGNWFQAVWDEKGKYIHGKSEITFGDVCIELYKNYCNIKIGVSNDMIGVDDCYMSINTIDNKYITLYVDRTNYAGRDRDDDLFAIVVLNKYNDESQSYDSEMLVCASGYAYGRIGESDDSWDGALCTYGYINDLISRFIEKHRNDVWFNEERFHKMKDVEFERTRGC